MRSLSLNFRNAVYAHESGQVAVILVTITHPSLSQPIYLSTDPTQPAEGFNTNILPVADVLAMLDVLAVGQLAYCTISRGHTYLFVGMEVSLPDERDRAPPTSKLTISNVDESLIPLIRSVTTQASVLMEGILASAPDTVEFSIPVLQVIGVDYDATTISLNLAMDALAIEPYPSGSFDPASFPGLFY